ncbi:Ribose 1,5-bisphosphate isomerase [uncultured archaeon]|nr:Ribose 1,5-bisphosphate isomerase [uncultured archaeon]
MSIKGFFIRRKKFNQIARDIKTIKIQGARNIAKAAIYAYSLISTQKSKNKLISLRPTEPMLHKVLQELEKGSDYEEILSHFDIAQGKINKNVFSTIKAGDTIFTHCHSTNVVNALIYSKQRKKKFEVFNTETRPLFQGRKTAEELSNSGINVTMFIDSALGLALSKKDHNGKNIVKKIFLGADALLAEGIINKIGSGLIADISKEKGIPVYIIADSWKFSPKKISFEQRSLNEIWDKAPKFVKIKNPAFEFVPKKNITKIITELGVMSYEEFLRKVRN